MTYNSGPKNKKNIINEEKTKCMIFNFDKKKARIFHKIDMERKDN